MLLNSLTRFSNLAKLFLLDSVHPRCMRSTSNTKKFRLFGAWFVRYGLAWRVPKGVRCCVWAFMRIGYQFLCILNSYI